MNTEFKPNSIKNLCMEIQAKGREGRGFDLQLALGRSPKLTWMVALLSTTILLAGCLFALGLESRGEAYIQSCCGKPGCDPRRRLAFSCQLFAVPRTERERWRQGAGSNC